MARPKKWFESKRDALKAAGKRGHKLYKLTKNGGRAVFVVGDVPHTAFVKGYLAEEVPLEG